jgi:hypothetical protein
MFQPSLGEPKEGPGIARGHIFDCVHIHAFERRQLCTCMAQGRGHIHLPFLRRLPSTHTPTQSEQHKAFVNHSPTNLKLLAYDIMYHFAYL